MEPCIIGARVSSGFIQSVSERSVASYRHCAHARRFEPISPI